MWPGTSSGEQTNTWVQRGATETREEEYCCFHRRLSFQIMHSYGVLEKSRLKRTQVFTMTFIATSHKQTVWQDMSQLFPPLLQKKQYRGPQKITFLNNKTKQYEQHLRTEGCFLRLQSDKMSSQSFHSLLFGTDNSAIKSSDRAISAKTPSD